MRDMIIIGGGIIGCSIARALSKYQLAVTLIEEKTDVAEGISKGNSGIIHAGYNEKPGTLKAKLCIRGNEMLDQLSKELDFSFKRNGALVAAFNEEEKRVLEQLLENGKALNVPGLKILSQEELTEQEPNINKEVLQALYIPTSGIVSPYEMTLAFAENAAENGVEFLLHEKVTGLEKTEAGFKVSMASGKVLESRMVINAAGLAAGRLKGLITEETEVTPVKGEYCLYNKMAASKVRHTLFQVPTAKGKGILVTPTIEGNLLLGPSAEEGSSLATSRSGLEAVLEGAEKVMPPFPAAQLLTTFTGVRPKTAAGDFIIEESQAYPGLIHLIGIDSPGLTAAPAIAEYVAGLVADRERLQEKKDFNPQRKGLVCLRDLSLEEQNEWIKKDPSYGNVICRCELVTEGDIKAAIHRTLGAVTVDGIKRRTRSAMGGCQGAGCLLKIAAVLAKELDVEITEVNKNNDHSSVVGVKEGK